MKIELISPAWKNEIWEDTKSIFPPLGLAMVAAVTPKGIDVRITDENIDNIDFDDAADLVGITAMTALAPRAYALADRFRKAGVPVVLGGMHASAVPHEAKEHADAVVIGEAENTWPQLIHDFLENDLQPFYQSAQRPKMSAVPFPRLDLLDRRKYLFFNTLQTTRGCPFSCSFCAVSSFFGRTYRSRPVSQVVADIKQVPGKYVGFVDDNIVGNPRRAKELFQALMPLKIKWLSQGSIDMARDPELVQMAADSGCVGMFIGFESLSPTNLSWVGKSKINRVDEFKEAIYRLHSHGISIEGAFVFGLEEDDDTVFETTVNFAQETRLEAAQFGILTPFPGTRLYDQLDQQGRIFDRSWSKYSISNVVYHPKRMSAATLQAGFDWAWREFYSLKSIIRRLGFRKSANPIIWAVNWNARKRVNKLLADSRRPRPETPQHQPS